MTAPRMVRCIECDRPLAVYGAEDDAPLCACCAEREPEAQPVQDGASASQSNQAA